MTNFKNNIVVMLLLTISLFISACSETGDESQKSQNDHVWKHQTDALKSAKDVAKKLDDQLKQQQQNIDDNH